MSSWILNGCVTRILCQWSKLQLTLSVLLSMKVLWWNHAWCSCKSKIYSESLYFYCLFSIFDIPNYVIYHWFWSLIAKDKCSNVPASNVRLQENANAFPDCNCWRKSIASSLNCMCSIRCSRQYMDMWRVCYHCKSSSREYGETSRRKWWCQPWLCSPGTFIQYVTEFNNKP